MNASPTPSPAPSPGRSQRIRSCVVAGGSGAVGGLFGEALASAGIDVCLTDLVPAATVPPGARLMPGDITAPHGALRTALAAADLVLLAVPEQTALDAVPALVGLLRPESLLADTLSVKTRFAAEVAARMPGQQAVGLNPMFAPSLGMAGRPVAATVLAEGPLVGDLFELVAEHGGRVVRMTPERHDRMAAASQTLTHATVLAFGQALAELDVDIDELAAVAPPPHATLLALLARIVSGTPEVYWDIQSANPLADDARDALARGVGRVRELARDGDEEAFAKNLRELSGVLGPRLPHYRDLCAELFARIPAADTEETP